MISENMKLVLLLNMFIYAQHFTIFMC